MSETPGAAIDAELLNMRTKIVDLADAVARLRLDVDELKIDNTPPPEPPPVTTPTTPRNLRPDPDLILDAGGDLRTALRDMPPKDRIVVQLRSGRHPRQDWSALERLHVWADDTATIHEPSSGAVLRLDGTLQVTTVGLDVSGGTWGIHAEGCKEWTAADCVVHHTRQEGVVFRGNSTGLNWSGGGVFDTGTGGKQSTYSRYAEGFYLGSDDPDDFTSTITVTDFEIARTLGEAVDIKPGCTNVHLAHGTITDIEPHNTGAIAIWMQSFVHPAGSPSNILLEDITITTVRTWKHSGTFPAGDPAHQWKDGNGVVISTDASLRNVHVFNAQHRGFLVDNNLEAGAPVVFEGCTSTGHGLVAFEQWGSNANVTGWETDR